MNDSLAGISIRQFLLVLVATGVLVGGVGIGGLIMLGLLSADGPGLTRDQVIFMVALSTGCIPLPLTWLVVVRGRVPWQALGWLGAHRRHLVLAVAVAAAYLTVGALVYRAAGLGPALDDYLRNDLGQYFSLGRPDPLRLVAFLLVVGPLAGIAEELLFRGFAFGWLRRRMNAVLAACLSAALFSAVHFHYIVPGGILGAAAAADIFVTGLLLAWLYQLSGSLAPSIVMHAVNNMAIILFVAFSL